MFVGVENACNSKHHVCLRTQQSSSEAQGEECFSIRSGGHLEAAGVEQQPQTYPRLRGQASRCSHNLTCKGCRQNWRYVFCLRTRCSLCVSCVIAYLKSIVLHFMQQGQELK